MDKKRKKLAIYIHGAGKVGRALARALGKHHRVTLRAARKGIPRKITADFAILAVRDRDLAPLAESLVACGALSKHATCVHVAGALGPEPLAPLRAVCAGVAQMHPMISFASPRFAPSLARGNMHIQGDAAAVRTARIIARELGMTARTIPKLDTIGYHAAAGLVANGAAALAAAGVTVLRAAGVSARDAPRMLGPLLRSVADNVETLGFPDALTGPVRRGDAPGIARQIATLRARAPGVLPLFVACGMAQVPLARDLGEAPVEAFDAIGRVFEDFVGDREPAGART